MNRDQSTDELIRDTLRQEDEQIAALLNNRPLTEDIVQSFRGHRRWLTIFPIILSLIYTALLVWCAYEFFQAETTKLQIAWATGVVCCGLSICTTKICVWGEWRRNSVIREVKRLELAVTELAKRLP